jgi:nucleotide-binding universal stress UspA family protein
MNEFTTIVVPLDGSSVSARALPVAKVVAERSGAEVILVTSTLDDRGATAAQLDEAVTRLPGLVVQCLTVDDLPPAEAASEVTLAGDDRLLCMSTHGRGGLRRAALGSVIDEVIRGGLIPVLVVGPSCDPAALDHPGPLELCVDGSTRSTAVVESGRRWAQLLDRDAQLVTVANPFDPATGPESADVFADLAVPLVEDGHYADGTCTYSSSVPLGLIGEAERLKTPLMVIAPASRSRWARLLIGSTTLGILSDAPCPVLVLSEGPFMASRAG